MKLMHNHQQVLKAAKFIFKKNKALHKSKSVTQIEDSIYNNIYEAWSKVQRDKELYIVGTMGYTLVFYVETDDVCIVECLVDPNVSNYSDMAFW